MVGGPVVARKIALVLWNCCRAEMEQDSGSYSAFAPLLGRSQSAFYGHALEWPGGDGMGGFGNWGSMLVGGFCALAAADVGLCGRA